VDGGEPGEVLGHEQIVVKSGILHTMSETNVVAQLDRWITELARKYERFFAKDPKVPVPPERERDALERRLREMSRSEPRTVAEQFKQEQLLHRFSTYNQLWLRMLREKEEGAARAAATSAAAAAPSGRPNAAATANVPDSEGEYRRLYSSYRTALEQSGKPAGVAFERFRAALDQQRRSAEAQGATVEGFDVVKEASGVKLRARIRRGKQG
jgi:hypothetical protein